MYLKQLTLPAHRTASELGKTHNHDFTTANHPDDIDSPVKSLTCFSGQWYLAALGLDTANHPAR